MDTQASWSVPILAKLNWPQLSSVSIFMVCGLICFSNKWQLPAYLPELFLTRIPKEPEKACKNEFEILTTHCQPHSVGWLVGLRETWANGFRSWKNCLSEDAAKRHASKKRGSRTVLFPLPSEIQASLIGFSFLFSTNNGSKGLSQNLLSVWGICSSGWAALSGLSGRGTT